MGDFWRGFREGVWITVKVFYPGVFLSMGVLLVYAAVH